MPTDPDSRVVPALALTSPRGVPLASSVHAGALGPGWETAPFAGLLVSADDIVLAANAAARALLPELRLGAHLSAVAPHWLTVQNEDGSASRPEGWIGQRYFTAEAVPDESGRTGWWLSETTDLRRAREGLRDERERTEFLHTASDALLASLNLARTMEVAAELAASRLAGAAWIVMPAVRGRHTATVCLRGEAPRTLVLDLRADEVPGLAEALQGFPPVPSRWLDGSSVQPWLVPEGFGELGSVVVTALPGHGVPAGALVLLRTAGQAAFSAEEEAVARLFAARVGAALSVARLFQEQTAITEVLSAELRPPELRRVDGVEYAGVYRPAQDSSRLGGDFYDVHPLPGGGALAVLGDVCGKGLEAAVLTGKIRTALHALLPLADDHGRVLELLNSSLLSAHHDRFVTLVLATAVREGEGVRLSLSRAGHLPTLVVRNDGTVEEIMGRGRLVGVLPSVDATTESVLLAPGETCLLHSDGLTEAVGGPLGGEMFGEDRLRRALAESAGLPGEALVEHVMMLATQWLDGPEHDDMAVLAITAPRSSGER